jgi:hypothetical protein
MNSATLQNPKVFSFSLLFPRRTMVTIHRVKGSSPQSALLGLKSGSSELDTEKYLSGLQRDVSEAFQKGDFQSALDLAKHARLEMEDYFKKDHVKFFSRDHSKRSIDICKTKTASCCEHLEQHCHYREAAWQL